MELYAVIFAVTASALLTRWIIRLLFPNRVVVVSPIDRAVLITGCDTGFGHYLALKAKAYGFYVFAGCLSASSSGAVALRSAGCHIFELDVTDPDRIEKARHLVELTLTEKSLCLHAIVNNAGVNIASGPVEWNTPEMVEKVLNVNTLGVFRVTRAFLPFVRAAKGRVVNVCSMAAHAAAPNLIPYCMSKSATLVFSNGLRRELKFLGVKVSTISPWFYSTNIVNESNMRRYALTSWDSTTPEARKAYGVGDSFEEYYDKLSVAKIPCLRHDISEVIDCMMDALTNASPKADYIPDVGSRVLACVMEMLPILWVDNVIIAGKKLGLST